MKKHKHLGIYGVIIENDNILLIEKANGPYKGKLDLPGGTPKCGETAFEVLKREIKEETNLTVEDAKLIDFDSVTVNWYEEDVINVHHFAAFYEIIKYKGNIKEKIEIDEKNDDSKGAKFYKISKLNKNNLSEITILELTKLGFLIK